VSPSRLYYGWIIVAALSITETVSWGIMYYGFSAMLRPMEADLRWSRVELTGAFSLGLLVAALFAVPVGRWIDRRGPRAIMTLGSCLGTVLVFAWSRVESLAALYAVWAGLGLAMAATLYEPAFAAIVGWFTRQRHRALTIVTLAAGLASTIFVPLATWLLTGHGWRAALVVLAVVLGVATIPVHALVLRRNPRGAGREPGDDHATDARESATLASALRTSVFWVLGAAFVLSNFATVSVTVHLIPFLMERGYAMSTAAAAVGWIGAMQLLGRLLFAPIAARVGPQRLTGAVFVVQAMAVAALPEALSGSRLAGVVVLLGAANGMATLSRATVVAEIFGAANYATISGALSVGSTSARAVGPVGASLLLAAFGSYPPVFWLVAAALAGGGVAVVTLGERTPAGKAARSAPTRR
jgi:MFS family permease